MRVLVYGWIEPDVGRVTRVAVHLEPSEHPVDAEALAMAIEQAVAEYEPIKAAGGSR